MTMEKPLLGEPSGPPAWIVLLVLCGVAFSSNLIISLIAPFLPQHFRNVGISQVWCGAIFSGFSGAMLVFTPVSAAAMGRVGRVPVLAFGLVLQGLSTLVFGFSDQLTGGPGVHPTAAVVVYLLSRIACGVGGACANNAIFSIVTDRFPDALGRVMALNEIVIGLGFTLGPPIGTALYLRGGFFFPFLVAGSISLILAPFAALLWRRAKSVHDSDGGAPEETTTFFEVLTPGLLVAAGCLTLGTGVFGVVEPILSLYLEDHVDVPMKLIGWCFAAMAISYSAIGPVMGNAADHVGPLKVCALGLTYSGLIMAGMLGPAAGLLSAGSVPRYAWEVGALTLLGVSQAATLIPTLPAMKAGVEKQGSSATERIVAWFNMFMQVGLVVGPLVSTSLVQQIGFEGTLAVAGTVIACYGGLAMRYAAVSAKRHDVARKLSGDSQESAIRRLSSGLGVATGTPTAERGGAPLLGGQ